MSDKVDLTSESRGRPVGICPRCHRPVWSFDQIGRKCGRPLTAGKTCPGVIRSAIGSDEWSQCPNCLGTGRVDGSLCQPCSGEGWTYARR